MPMASEFPALLRAETDARLIEMEISAETIVAAQSARLQRDPADRMARHMLSSAERSIKEIRDERSRRNPRESA